MNNQRVGHARVGLAAGWLAVALLAGYATRAEAVSAAGGTVTQYVDAGGTNWVAHLFTDVGTTNLTVTSGGDIEVLVVGGGGGGGKGFGAGGGAGGYRELTSNVVAGTYAVVVGDGGAGAATANTRGSSGSPSSFAGIQAAGGGGGGGGDSGTGQPNGAAGGSGGGGSHQGAGGAGNTPATSPSQGNSGANGGSGVYGGGGGGAGAAATDKNGGSGRYSAITGVSVERAGGGGGNSTTGRGAASGGGGGLVGGVLTSAASNTGGGGYGDGDGTNNRGGSGIVVVRYAVSYPLVQNRPVSDVTTSSATLNGTLATSTGAPPAEAVSVLWGPDPDAWASTNAWTGGGWTNGTPFSTNVASGIGANTTYYYTFRAATAATNVTASPPVSFITGVVTVEATAPTAQYPGSSGEFTIRRPATCTNAALTVPYTLGGSAVSNVDYTLSSWSSVTLEAGQANRVVTVSPLPDFDSANENVVLTLGAGAYPTGAMVTATVTILPAEVGVKAMGGTVTTYREGGANWTAHSFTDVGTTSLTVTADGVIEVLVVGGGGGGGWGYGAGGGAGGYREFVSGIVAGTHMVVVGDGGAGAATSNTRGSSGSPSSFAGLQAAGGGGGGGGDSGTGQPSGAAGGSGGGGSHQGVGGAGNTPATSPSQGNSGANGSFGVYGGGGGGAGAAASAQHGGAGRYSAITGVFVGRAGGGGGNAISGAGGLGTASEGGGGKVGGVTANATPNTGGGGRGDGGAVNGKGGSGIVVVRYQSLPKGTVVIIR